MRSSCGASEVPRADVGRRRRGGAGSGSGEGEGREQGRGATAQTPRRVIETSGDTAHNPARRRRC